jgi:hypothetical protein
MISALSTRIVQSLISTIDLTLKHTHTHAHTIHTHTESERELQNALM